MHAVRYCLLVQWYFTSRSSYQYAMPLNFSRDYDLVSFLLKKTAGYTKWRCMDVKKRYLSLYLTQVLFYWLLNSSSSSSSSSADTNESNWIYPITYYITKTNWLSFCSVRCLYKGERLRLPEFLDNRHMKVVRSSALRTGRLYLQKVILVLIDVRSWVYPRDIIRLEGLSQWRIPPTPTENEPVTFRLVAQCPNHMRHRVPPLPI